MIKSNLAAWTPYVPNPPYISINLVESIEPIVEITVRGNEKKDGNLGDVVTVKMLPKEYITLVDELSRNLELLRNGKG
jgi:hypothetical protein